MDPEQRKKELARRKRERIIIVATLIAVAVVTYFETRIPHFSSDLPLGSSVLIFALINVNALLLLLLIFLVFRNLVKLMLEQKRGVLGSKLRAKLVIAFVLLSLAPTILLFFAAFQFVGTSMEYWFSVQVERSLYDALEVSESYNRQIESTTSHFAELVGREMSAQGLSAGASEKRLTSFLESQRDIFDLTALKVFDRDLNLSAQALQSGTHPNHLQGLPMEVISRALATGRPQTHLQEAPTGDFAAAVHPIVREFREGESRAAGAVVAFRLLPPRALAKSQEVRAGLEDYRQLKSLKRPMKTHQYITLSIVTLLIIFGATWFGFYLAKTITVPLMELAQGTQRVAGGDYDFFIDAGGTDEIGTLVNAFNRMTADLKTSKARLDEAQKEMSRTSVEMDQRRRYMEIILNNVAAGVIAVDAKGIISAFNPSAERLLKIQASSVMDRNWRELLSQEYRPLVESMLVRLLPGGRGTVDEQVRINVGGENLTLMVHLSLLRDERGRQMGVVVVFENLTELEKAQRMAAWREVARRIAHEVKNPLTPIKLSAQRLVRRYSDRLGPEEEVFTECTSTIIRQVEELRRLVNEFSTFARLPTARPAPADLTAIAQEAISLFKSGHAGINFELEAEEDIPVFDLDREQMSRVMINLLDNAVAAVNGQEGPRRVAVHLTYDDILKIVRLEVEDSGPGVRPEDKLRLFEPYFSTKKTGTGLGLTIVNTIITDHGGYIRVQDNEPKGTRIIVELPARGARAVKAEA